MLKNLGSEIAGPTPERGEALFAHRHRLDHDRLVEIVGQGWMSQGGVVENWGRRRYGTCLGDSTDKGGQAPTIEVSVVSFRRPAGTRFCGWDRYPALETPGYCQMSLTGHSRMAYAATICATSGGLYTPICSSIPS